jgi:uncharacterized membrane protein
MDELTLLESWEISLSTPVWFSLLMNPIVVDLQQQSRIQQGGKNQTWLILISPWFLLFFSVKSAKISPL